MLKKGDMVVMHTCGESDYYKGKIWTCRTNEFTSSAKQQVVFLEGFSGYFLVDYLQIVDLQEEIKGLSEGYKIAEDLSKQVSELQEQLSELVCAIYEHANEGTELMEIAQRIDEME